ncbi:MAG: phage tail protein [Xanthomonadaceae bacterium]|nr:phage tail protein [Xanthomonadaceae bacterium]
MAARTSQFDPYRTFKFRVRLDGAIVAGVTRVSPLSRSVAPNEVKEAGDAFGARQMPGMISFDEVTLEQGWSADRTFESWANQVLTLHADPASARDFKRTVFIEVFDLDGNVGSVGAGSPSQRYKLHRAWVSKYVAMPELNADGAGVGIASVSLRHEGWERV